MLTLVLALACADATLLDGMGSYSRKVSTTSPDAQRWFDQGLTLAYAFMHDEAARSFQRASELDPELAIAHWGYALVLGPHINAPYIEPAKLQQAQAALTRAQSAKHASDVERALIEALTKRYGADGARDADYTAAMKRVHARFPDDVDVTVLTAEALLDVHPWDLYDAKRRAKPHTAEIVKLLDEALARAPLHPGANHLHVHALEEGSVETAARARVSADRLRSGLVPGAGHLLHMPAHIDARTGAWGAAVAANESAMAADKAYLEGARRRGVDVGNYALYVAHSPHHLAFVAMMDGQERKARAAARAALDAIPRELIESNAEAIDGYLAMPVEVLVRFGRWDEILKEPEPDERFRIRRALRRHARGIALAALGRVDEARAEHNALLAERKALGDRPFGMNKGGDVVDIADHMLLGEIEVRAGKLDRGIALLREAVKREDKLRFDEPPPWTLPVRHALGAALLLAKQPADAERVYLDDLARHPENGWALTGLAKALAAQGKDASASAQSRAAAAFARADNKPTSSCECLP